MTLHYKEGTYGVEVTEQHLSKSSNENPMVMIRFKPDCIQAGSNAQTGEPEWDNLSITNYERTTYLVVTENTIDSVCKRLRQIGIVISDWGHVDQNHPECCSIVGKRVAMACKHEVYQSKDKESWGIPLVQAASEVKALSMIEIAEMNAAFGDALRDMLPEGPTRQDAAGEQPTAPESEEENDMPF